MTAEEVGPEPSVVSPDEAFAILGNKSRFQILQALADADEPVSFSELRETVGMADPGQFNYHLNKLKDRFIGQSDSGYELRESGSIIIQAILSGTVTQAPVITPTRLDLSCPYCESPIELSYSEDRVLVRCLTCGGTYSGSESDARSIETHPDGTIAVYGLPPAGLKNQTPEAVLTNGLVRMHQEIFAMASGICPRCSAAVTNTLQVCGDHEADADICTKCKRRHALYVDHHCTNCIRMEENVPLGLHLVSNPRVLSFMAARDVNPIIPNWDDLSIIYDYEETIRSVDPFEARLIYRIRDYELTVTVDEECNVTEIIS